MHPSPPAPFRQRLLRMLLIIAVVTTALVALGVCAAQLIATRRMLMENLDEGVRLSARMIAAGIEYEGERAELFPHPQGLDLLCIYNQANRLTRRWQAPGYAGDCPALVREAGLREHGLSVTIAEPVMADGAYGGIVYAQATLSSYAAIALQAARIFLALMLAVIPACFVAAHYGARHFHHLLGAIRQQIDCLKSHTSECILAPALATSETMALFQDIRSLQIHLVSSLVPKETVTQASQWYESIFFNLFSLLRHRIAADSPLISILSDCELFLRLGTQEALPPPELTDITRIVEEAVASARILSPPDSRVHLVVSCKPAILREWDIQAGYVKTLIRHLMFIAFARTRKGLICLRVETRAQPMKVNQAMLEWRLEDSGAPIQPGVLHSKLTAAPYKIVSVADASWWLAVQLTKRLGGAIRGENANRGLLLSGEIPLGYPKESAPQDASPHPVAERSHDHPRLVLMVADASQESYSLCLALERLDCQVVWADTHKQALELAPVMPFSAVIFNKHSFSYTGHDAVRQLAALRENKAMPAVALWAVTTSEAASEHKAWTAAGVNELLIAPIGQKKLASLCRGLMPFNVRFWAVCDAKVQAEFSDAIRARLPRMQADLAQQIRRVHAALVAAQGKPVATEVLHAAHAVKSMALGLGYMHLAAFMANVEQALGNPHSAHTAKNIAVFVDCLKKMRIE